MVMNEAQQRSQKYIVIGILLILVAIGMFTYVLITQWKMSALS